MTTPMQHQPPPQPHDFENNIVRISTWRNVQKVRKPNVNITLRSKSYWDLRGRWQREYDVRLDTLPDDGIANTVAGEIFRAATKIFYDFHNNAMVNNTSGALNYLVENGVLYRPRAPEGTSSKTTLRHEAAACGRREVIVPYDDEIYDILHPYTIGARILLDGNDYNDVARTVESLIDRTIELIRATPKLDIMSNTIDYNNLREADVVTCIERCAIRNRRAQEMNTQEMVMMMMNMTTTTHPTMTTMTMDKELVAQDHHTANSILPAAVVTPPSSTNKKYNNPAPLVTNAMNKKIKSRKYAKNKKNRSSTTPLGVVVGGGVDNKGMGNNNTNAIVKVVG